MDALAPPKKKPGHAKKVHEPTPQMKAQGQGTGEGKVGERAPSPNAGAAGVGIEMVENPVCSLSSTALSSTAIAIDIRRGSGDNHTGVAVGGTVASRARSTSKKTCSDSIFIALGAMLTFWGFAFGTSLLYIIASSGRTWWLAPPLQSLFFIAQLCSMAELTLTFARIEPGGSGRCDSGMSRRSSIFILSLFSLCAILYAGAPQFAYEKRAPFATMKYSTGNCTDLRTLRPEDQNKMRRICSGFSDISKAFLKPAEQLREYDNSGGPTHIQDVLEVIEKIVDHLPLFGMLIDSASDHLKVNPFQKMLVTESCALPFASLTCESAFLRCNYGDCSFPRKPRCSKINKWAWGTCTGEIDERRVCPLHAAMRAWAKCAMDHSGEYASGIEAWRRRKNESLEVIQMIYVKVGDLMTGNYNPEDSGSAGVNQIWNFLSKREADVATFILAELKRLIRESSPRSFAFDQGAESDSTLDECSADSSPKFASLSSAATHNAWPDDPTLPRLGCDPSSRTYVLSSAQFSVLFNSGHMLLAALTALSGAVACGSERLPLLSFASTRDRNARVLSMMLGMVSSTFIYMSAAEYENAALAKDTSNPGDAILLRAFAVVHLLVTFLMTHHAIFLLVSGPDEDNILVACLRRRYMFCDRAVRTSYSCTRGNGRFFVVYLMLRETVECLFQLLGIDNTARVADVQTVRLRSAVLCLNLIALPSMTAMAFLLRGRTAAKVCWILIESLFDNLFIAVGVTLQLDTAAYLASSSTVLGHISHSLPTLLPAILYFTTDQTPLMVIAEMSKLREVQKYDAAVRRIQGLWRRVRRLSASASQHMADIVVEAIRKNHKPEQTKRTRSTKVTRQSSGRRAICFHCVLLRIQCAHVAWTSVGLASFIFGAYLWTYVESSIRAQEVVCAARLGSIARCLSPRIYFQAGLFNPTDCAFDSVQSANCSDGRLVDRSTVSDVSSLTEVLPEVPLVYSNMHSLTRIDVSGNVALRGVPSSWHLIPRLRSINVSNCSMLRRVPFKICAKNSSTLNDANGLDVWGTPASRELDWSGELRWKYRPDQLHMPEVSEACLGAFSATLVRLDLSSNQITYEEFKEQGSADKTSAVQREHMKDRLRMIRAWQRLSFLNLSYNLFERLDSDFFTLMEHIQTNAEVELMKNEPNVGMRRYGVEVRGNPIVTLMIVAQNSSRVMRQLRDFGSYSGEATRLCDLRGLKKLELSAIIGPKEPLWNVLRSSCYIDTLEEFGLTAAQKPALPVVQKGTFDFLAGVKVFDFSGNHIKKVEAGAFQKLVNMERLHLSGNAALNLREVVSELSVTGKLKQLELNVMDIERIENGTFSSLTALTRLGVDFNSIKTIGPGTFQGLTSLNRLDIRENGLERIAKDTFDLLPNLDILCAFNGNKKLNASRHAMSLWGLSEDAVANAIEEVELIGRVGKGGKCGGTTGSWLDHGGR